MNISITIFPFPIFSCVAENIFIVRDIQKVDTKIEYLTIQHSSIKETNCMGIIFLQYLSKALKNKNKKIE